MMPKDDVIKRFMCMSHIKVLQFLRASRKSGEVSIATRMLFSIYIKFKFSDFVIVQEVSSQSLLSVFFPV